MPKCQLACVAYCEKAKAEIIGRISWARFSSRTTHRHGNGWRPSVVYPSGWRRSLRSSSVRGRSRTTHSRKGQTEHNMQV